MITIIGNCLFALTWLLLSLGMLTRLLPGVFAVSRRVLRGILILSFRLYRLILGLVAPFVQRRLGIDILNGFWRVAATLFFSLVTGLISVWLVSRTVNGLWIGLCIIHGLAVGLAWDEIENPAGLQLGTRIQ